MPVRREGFSVFLIATSIGLALLVVVLSYQNRELARVLAHESGRTASEGFERFAPGEILPPLALRAVDGSSETLAFGAGAPETLLLFYAEACTTCPEVFLAWEELAPLFEGHGVRVAAVQLDRTGASAPYGPLGIASFAVADFARVPVAKMATVPLALLVDGTGAVEWAHYGTLSDGDKETFVSFLPRGR